MMLFNDFSVEGIWGSHNIFMIMADDVYKGRRIIVGDSASGKSTLARLMAIHVDLHYHDKILLSDFIYLKNLGINKFCSMPISEIKVADRGEKILERSIYRDSEHHLTMINRSISAVMRSKKSIFLNDNFISLFNKYLVHHCAPRKIDQYTHSFLSKLSFSELRIISIFLFVHAYDIKHLILDCPENGLSVENQITLITDLIANFELYDLLVMTHSPFIFDNDLARSAVDIDFYINKKFKIENLG